MKILFCIAAVFVFVGAWVHFRQSPEAPPSLDSRRVSKPTALTPVSPPENGNETLNLVSSGAAGEMRPPFAVKVSAGRLFSGWRQLQFAEDDVEQKGLRRYLRREVEAIRARLHSDGFFSEGAVRKHILKAAEELGHRPDEARYVVNQVLSLAKADKEPEADLQMQANKRALAPGF